MLDTPACPRNSLGLCADSPGGRSPDGDYVVFRFFWWVNTSSYWLYDVYRIAPNGTGKVNLTADEAPRNQGFVFGWRN